MKRTLLIALFLLVPACAKAQFVQYVAFNETTSTTSGTPISMPALAGVGANHRLIAWIGIDQGAGSLLITPSDTFGLTWIPIQSAFSRSSSLGFQIDGYCALTGASSGADTVQFAWAPASTRTPRAFVAEYSSGSCQVVSQNMTGANGTTCTTAALNSLITGDLFHFVFLPSTTVSAWTGINSFTLRSSSSAIRSGIADFLSAAPGGHVSIGLSWTTTAISLCSSVELNSTAQTVPLGSKQRGPTTASGGTQIR